MVIFLLLLFWFICSGQDSLFFIIAAILSVIFTLVIDRKLFSSFSFFSSETSAARIEIKYLINLSLKFFLLLKEMFISSLRVGRIIWFDSKKVQPCCILVDAKSANKLEQVIQANAITLTPGTMSLHLDDNKILIHAINSEMLEEYEEK